MDKQRFNGKRILITGGSSGMGLATAELMVQEGAQVIITGRNQGKLEKAAQTIGAGDRIIPIVCDVSQVEEIDRLMAIIKEQVGSLDIIFANAGSGIFKSFAEFSEADFDQQVATNFKGTFFTVQKALPLINDGGAVVINASWTFHRPMGPAALYSATKAAIANLARTLTTELSNRRIRVNAVSPGYINTDQFNEAQLSEGEAAWRSKEVPLGRFGKANEVAQVVAFLASDEASYLAGQDILVDGGLARSKVE